MAKRNAGLTVSKEVALAEVGQVLLARESLALFGEYASEGGWWKAYEMHHLIAHYLEQVVLYLQTGGQQGLQFLMILTPPQHGKSWLVSRLFPAWALGKMPDLRFLAVSYGADLASDNSRAVRNLITSQAYQAVFGSLSPNEEPVQLSSDSRAVAAWDLASPHRGGMVAAGNGGALSGRQRGVLLWDDPIKDHRAALSEDVREDAWDFYRSVLRPRTQAGVLVMTHWHPDDPAGRIMKQMATNPNADQWKIIMLPGIVEPGLFATSKDEQRRKMLEGVYMPLRDLLKREDGQVLCPGIMSREEMLKIRETSDDFYFSALYQQSPYLRQGNFFRREYFTVVERVPEGVTLSKFAWYWDKAATAGAGDYSAGVLMAMGSDGIIYVLHAVRGKLTPHDRDNLMVSEGRASIERWQTNIKIYHQKDPAAAGKESAQSTNLKLAAAGLTGAFEPVTGDKEDRAGPWQSSLQGGGVRLLRAAWNEAYIDEHVAFPNGKHDDWVDCSASCHFKVRVVAMKDVKSYQG